MNLNFFPTKKIGMQSRYLLLYNVCIHVYSTGMNNKRKTFNKTDYIFLGGLDETLTLLLFSLDCNL